MFMIRFKNQLPNYHSCIMAQKRKKKKRGKKGKKKNNNKLQNSIIEPNERQIQLQFLIMFIVHNANYFVFCKVQCVCLYVYIYAACSLLSSCYENDKANFIISLISKKGNRDPEKNNPSSHLFLLCQLRYFLTVLLKASQLLLSSQTVNYEVKEPLIALEGLRT